MPGLGYKVFPASSILASSDVNNYLMQQAVMVFAGSAARGSAIGTAVSEGMVSYLQDSNLIEFYDGSNWQAVGNITAVGAGTGLSGGGSSGSVTINVSNVPASEILTSVGTLAAGATAYTAVAGDANNVIYSLATAAVTITVPDLFTIGDRIDIIRDAAGTVSIVAGTGTSSWAGAGTAGTAIAFKIDQQYNGATVLKVANNTYRVIGKVTV